MRLDLTEAEEQASLLENPLSNGALLLDLSCLWIRATTSVMPASCSNRTNAFSADAMWKAPQTIPGAMKTVASALHALGLAGPPQADVGHHVLQQDASIVEAVVQGNMQAVWGIISQVMVSLKRAHNILSSGKHRWSQVYDAQ